MGLDCGLDMMLLLGSEKLVWDSQDMEKVEVLSVTRAGIKDVVRLYIYSAAVARHRKR